MVWRVPMPVAGSAHPYQYRLFYGYPECRVIGYDNEHGKVDHPHYTDQEECFRFTTPERLIDDFLADAKLARGL